MGGRLVNKLCLGTVQFGLDYGIANPRGKVTKDEAFHILNDAYAKGINTFDTAYSYGDSEVVLGEFIRQNACHLKILSKLPTIEGSNAAQVRSKFFASMERLKVKKMYGYFIHKFDEFLRFQTIWPVLEQLKEEGFVEKIGFSIYRPQELVTLLDLKVDFDILQFPYSVFDRRFEQYFEILKEKQVEVFVRSIFLQGLVFLAPDSLPQKLAKVRPVMQKLHSLALGSVVSVEAICLNFVLVNPGIDKVIVGVDSREHLRSNIEHLQLHEKVKILDDKLGVLKIDDEDILLPYKWS